MIMGLISMIPFIMHVWFISKADEKLAALNTRDDGQSHLREGFHPIYVYHGPGNSIQNLKSLSSEMKQHYNTGSQVDQDKIISALTRKMSEKIDRQTTPFFIDLAANDAIQLSNTLHLEAAGWNGLCVGKF